MYHYLTPNGLDPRPNQMSAGYLTIEQRCTPHCVGRWYPSPPDCVTGLTNLLSGVHQSVQTMPAPRFPLVDKKEELCVLMFSNLIRYNSEAITSQKTGIFYKKSNRACLARVIGRKMPCDAPLQRHIWRVIIGFVLFNKAAVSDKFTEPLHKFFITEEPLDKLPGAIAKGAGQALSVLKENANLDDVPKGIYEVFKCSNGQHKGGLLKKLDEQHKIGISHLYFSHEGSIAGFQSYTDDMASIINSHLL